tara:strand:+ start:7897 stop:10626 length:2730 start_codon:yes stop_codon:yes gene_type:complete
MARQEGTVQPMQQQVKSDLITTPASFGESYANAALTPTMLGQLGSSLSNTASMELNKRRGIEAGLNPSGDILPPLTNADKAYADAYQNQSQATLTNQANDLFNKANENMSKLNKITTGSIGEYQKTMTEGLGDILKLAPNDVRASLANQFTGQMQTSTSQYNMRMISQNKAESVASSGLALSNLNEQVHTAALDGKLDSAAKLFEDSLAMIARGKNGGIYTPSQATVLGKTAHLNYLSSLEIQKGITARNAGKIDEWYASLANEKSKPEGVSWNEWETVRANSATYLNGVTSLGNQQQTLIASNGAVDIAQGTMNAEKMESYQSQLKESPKLFNQLQIQYATQLRKTNKNGLSTNFIASNWKNIDITRNGTPQQINDASEMLSSMYQKTSEASGHPISKDEAEYQVAANATVPVPAYNKKITSYATSGNPNLMMNALQTYNRLSDLPGFKAGIASTNKNAIGTLHSFEHFIEQGLDATTAANMATLINSDKTNERTQLINKATSDYLKDYNTATKLQSWAFNQAGIHMTDVIDDPTSVASSYLSMFKDNMQWVGGNADVALKMTNKAYKQAWGISNVNGKPTFGFLPPEKMIGLDEGAVPLMQLDIADQVKNAIKETNAAHDAGNYDWGYRVVERPGLDEYAKAKKSIRELGINDPEGGYHKEIIDEFEAGAPVEIERVRNGKQIKPTLTPPGLIEKENINLANRKQLNNADGTESTVSTMTVGMDDKTYLIPSVIDGKRLSQKEAINHFKKTKEHMGAFKTLKDADLYDEALHQKMGWLGKHNKWPKYFEDGEVQKFTTKIITNPWQGIDRNTGQLTGGYDIALVNKETGMTEPFQGLFTNTNMNPTYNPRTDWIASNYMVVNGLNPNANSHEEFLKQYASLREQQKDMSPLKKSLTKNIDLIERLSQ